MKSRILGLIFLSVAMTGLTFAATMTMSPSTLAYGNVNVGGNGVQQVTIKNTGPTPVSVTAINIGGGGASSFGYSGVSLPKSLAPNGTALVTVTFTPSGTGAVSATLSITTNPSATVTPSSVSLTGTGVTVTVGVNFPSWNFGQTFDEPGSLPLLYPSLPSTTITLTNTGSASLNISSITLSGSAAYSLVSPPTTPLTVPPGQQIQLSTQYTPSVSTSTAGPTSAQISVVSNATGSPLIIPLNGTGAHWILLGWTASVTPGATYNIYRSTLSGTYGPIPIGSSTGTAYYDMDPSLTPGTTYYYVVTAYTGSSESAYSPETSATVAIP